MKNFCFLLMFPLVVFADQRATTNYTDGFNTVLPCIYSSGESYVAELDDEFRIVSVAKRDCNKPMVHYSYSSKFNSTFSVDLLGDGVYTGAYYQFSNELILFNVNGYGSVIMRVNIGQTL